MSGFSRLYGFHQRLSCALLCCSLLVSFSSTTLAATTGTAQSAPHALVMYGDKPKYPKNFTHFDYANPDAPKGGKMVIGEVGSFDSLNPFIMKGVKASYLGLMYDTLTSHSLDEPFTEYGLLAESIELASDNKSIIFNLRKDAKFHDGKPVTADDVTFTFKLLMEEGAPFYRSYYQDVVSANALGKYKVEFTFRHGDNRELPLIVGQLPVLPKHYWKGKTFTDNLLDVPVGSGPYRIKRVKTGQSITYERDPNYWGKDLGVNKGLYNFAELQVDYYLDSNVALEGFKAGSFDFIQETSSKRWANQYSGPLFSNKKVIKSEIEHHNPAGMQAFVMNIRNPLFADAKVRHALNLAFDFEWANKKLFYGAYKRNNSFFENSELAATGLPSKAELALLNPLKKIIPAEVFTKEYKNPVTDGSGRSRKQLREAITLLKQAGWSIKNRQLVNKTGKAFTFEILLVSKDFERIVLPYVKNLKRLGITATPRVIDQSQYIERRRDFKFDMIVGSFPQSSSPGNEQRDFWFSEFADKKGSRNIIGIKNPAVDQLVDHIINADSREALVTACRALDRVLLWEYYVIPQWYINTNRVAHKASIKRPKISPQYGLGLSTWWIEPN